MCVCVWGEMEQQKNNNKKFNEISGDSFFLFISPFPIYSLYLSIAIGTPIYIEQFRGLLILIPNRVDQQKVHANEHRKLDGIR